MPATVEDEVATDTAVEAPDAVDAIDAVAVAGMNAISTPVLAAAPDEEPLFK